jgi:hypothetical protein
METDGSASDYAIAFYSAQESDALNEKEGMFE